MSGTILSGLGERGGREHKYQHPPLLPVCRHNVTSHLMLLLPCLPSMMDRLYPENLGQNKPFLSRVTFVFVTVMRKIKSVQTLVSKVGLLSLLGNTASIFQGSEGRSVLCAYSAGYDQVHICRPLTSHPLSQFDRAHQSGYCSRSFIYGKQALESHVRRGDTATGKLHLCSHTL